MSICIPIERARYQDLGDILALQKLAYQKEANRYNDHAIPPLKQKLEEIQAEFGHTVFLKATTSDRIVGSIKGRVENGTCHVGRLMVHPAHRGRGLAKRLIQHLEMVMQGLDSTIQRFELFTGELSHDNIHLYEGQGYRVFKIEPYDACKNVVYMEKDV